MLLTLLATANDTDARASYWEDEAHTKAAMKPDEDGTMWMYTGDEAVMDEEGYVRSEFEFVMAYLNCEFTRVFVQS